MKSIKLTDEIRLYVQDDNIVMMQSFVISKGKRIGETGEKMLGYFPSLETAWDYFCDNRIFRENKKVEKIIEDLKKVKSILIA